MREAGAHRLGARIGALFVALALSGAMPQVGAVAQEREHRCACHHAPGELCSCLGCRRAAADARRARLAAMPPCHRAAAIDAIAGEERETPGGAAVVAGRCDTPERQWITLRDSSPYLRPGAVVLLPITANGLPPPTRLHRPEEVPREIPTPPPRLA